MSTDETLKRSNPQPTMFQSPHINYFELRILSLKNPTTSEKKNLLVEKEEEKTIKRESATVYASVNTQNCGLGL